MSGETTVATGQTFLRVSVSDLYRAALQAEGIDIYDYVIYNCLKQDVAVADAMVRLVTPEELGVDPAILSQVNNKDAIMEVGRKAGLFPLPTSLAVPAVIVCRKFLSLYSGDQNIVLMMENDPPNAGGGPYMVVYSPPGGHMIKPTLGWRTLQTIGRHEHCVFLYKTTT